MPTGNHAPIPAHVALERLREGNRLFASGELSRKTRPSHSRVAASAQQAPFAIILGCSDSRVPAEIVFGQGLGGPVRRAGANDTMWLAYLLL